MVITDDCLSSIVLPPSVRSFAQDIQILQHFINTHGTMQDRNLMKAEVRRQMEIIKVSSMIDWNHYPTDLM